MNSTRIFNQASITRARAVSADELYLSVSPDENDVGDPFSRISSFANSEWFHRDYQFWVTSMTDFLEEGHIAPRLVFIGEHGEFIDFSKPDEIDMGLSAETRESKGLGDGYLYCVKQIGKHL